MTDVPPAQRKRWVLPAVAGLAAVWAAALGTLAATTADPPTLNRAQLARADALVRAEVVDPGGKGGATLRVENVLPLNGATADGLAAAGLAAGAEVTAARFPRGGAAAGERRGGPGPPGRARLGGRPGRRPGRRPARRTGPRAGVSGGLGGAVRRRRRTRRRPRPVPLTASGRGPEPDDDTGRAGNRR